jgi:hypothetical protein
MGSLLDRMLLSMKTNEKKLVKNGRKKKGKPDLMRRRL